MTRLGRGCQFPRQRKDARGRVRVYLGKGHPLADRSGWCWRSRLIAGRGERLPTHLHVDHRGDRDDDRLAKLRIVPASEHNREHARKQARDKRGRWI